MTTIPARVEGARRLSILATYLHDLPETKLSLIDWTNVYSLQPDIDTVIRLIIDHACPTTACAVGHACTIPALNQEGLHLGRRHVHRFSASLYCPEYKEVGGWCAVCCFFDLNYAETHWLFEELPYYALSETPNKANFLKRLQKKIGEMELDSDSGWRTTLNHSGRLSRHSPRCEGGFE